MYWIGQDVTELKRSTVSLEILEEVTATGVWELDKQTNTPYWSKKTHQIHQTESQHFTPLIDDALSFSRLPRTACHPETMSDPISTPPSTPETPDMSHLRVLIAEDNEINQLVVGAFLLDCGTQVTFVDNGARLVEAVKSTQYDLILCDIRMPVMGGIEDSTKIREFNPDIPIWAFTANVMQDDVRAYREAGFTNVISKPVERLKLFEQLAGYSQPRS